MFSVNQKRAIADAVQKILRETNHPELPNGEINFSLHVDGAESWSWADIRNNGAVTNPGVNPWNESQEQRRASRMNAPDEPRYTVDEIRKWQDWADGSYFVDDPRNGIAAFTARNKESRP